MIYYGLLLFFFFEYFRPSTYLPVLSVLHANSVIPVLIFLFTFFKDSRVNNGDILKNSSSKYMLFFLSCILISILTADVTLYAFNTFKAVFGYFLIYIVISKQVNSIDKMKGIFVLLSIIHILLVILNPDIIMNPETRSYISGVTFLGDGNDFALSLNITIPFCLFLIQDSKNKTLKIIFIVMVIIMILCIIGTQSRGGSIALACVMAYQWLKSRKKIMGIILIFAIVMTVFMFAPPVYFERMNTMKNYEEEGSAQGRIMAWKSAIKMANDHPFLGVGGGHFPVKFGLEYRPPGYGPTDLPWANAHSVFFLMLGEFGYVGLFILLALIFLTLIKSKKSLRVISNHDPTLYLSHQKLLICLKSSMIAFTVGGMFLSALYYPHLYIVTALFTARDMMLKAYYKEAISKKSEQDILSGLHKQVPQKA